MRSRRILLLAFLVIVVALIVLIARQPRDLASLQFGNNIVFADSAFVLSDQRESMVVIGADTITLEQGSQIDGDVALIALSGAPIQIDGHVTGDLTAMGGPITLGESGRVDGDANLVGDNLEVNGAVTGAVTLSGDAITLSEDSLLGGAIEVCGVQSAAVNDLRKTPGAFTPCKSVTDIAPSVSQWLISGVAALAYAGIAALGVALFPNQVSQMEEVIRRRPRGMFGLGLATLALALGLSGILVVALASGPVLGLVLTPVYLILVAVLGATGIAGTVTLALMVGDWLTHRLGWQSPPMVMAMIGGLSLGVLFGLIAALPVVDIVAAFAAVLLTALGLGAALHTRLGTRQIRRRFFVQG
ncbi:MAG: polymer-forming cytoskeletal protein [Anaerolineae bacterium]|nr:polymer-forming cytoskeletal protein [Anaerolineae bacterium]